MSLDITDTCSRNEVIIATPELGTSPEYFCQVIRCLEMYHGLSGLRIVIIHSSLCDVLIQDEKTIVILTNEEQSKIPAYINNLRAVLSAYPLAPCYAGGFLVNHRNILACLEYLRRVLFWSKSWTRAYAAKRGRMRQAIDIPPGYHRKVDPPAGPFLDRPYIMTFMGSVKNQEETKWNWRSLYGDPKTNSRRTMLAAMAVAAERFGQERVYCHVTRSYWQSRADQTAHYVEMLSNSQICLAPRGRANGAESPRVFEGLRCGCVVISDRLPDRWFYRGSPIIQLDDWRDMPEIVAGLIADPAAFEDLHRRSLRWWQNVCSEGAVAAFIAHELGLANDDSCIAMQGSQHG